MAPFGVCDAKSDALIAQVNQGHVGVGAEIGTHLTSLEFSFATLVGVDAVSDTGGLVLISLAPAVYPVGLDGDISLKVCEPG